MPAKPAADRVGARPRRGRAAQAAAALSRAGAHPRLARGADDRPPHHRCAARAHGHGRDPAPLTRFVGPHITVCNLFTTGFAYAGEAGMEPAAGRAQRSLVNFLPPPTNRRSTAIWAASARRSRYRACTSNALPAAIDNKGNADCEAGQRGYLERVATFAPKDRDDRDRPGHARQPGPDLHRPPPRAQGPDLLAPARDRAGLAEGAPQVNVFGGKNAFRIGAIVLIVLAVVSYAAFTRYNPFANPYRVQAAFKGPQDVRVNSAVRLAGVDIGKVTAVEEGPQEGTSVIEMEIEEEGAARWARTPRFKVRPRLFLEGNYFIDVRPGTPGRGGAGGGRRGARHADGRAGVGRRPAEDLREQHARERAHAAGRVRPRRSRRAARPRSIAPRATGSVRTGTRRR